MNRAAIQNRVVTATTEHEIGKNQFVVAPGLWRIKDVFVNCYLVQNTGDRNNWILVDTGLKSTGEKIGALAKDLFGKGNSRPSAIVLTHGHFDHVGSLLELASAWNVPVYCHKLELPFLTGKSEYPPADPSVGGGLMAYLSFAFPKGSVNISDRIEALPDDGTVPGMPEWRWIHTPGHAPGHISLYRERDGVLVAGDAVTATDQSSVISVATQRKKLHGPPQYFTPDWGASARSVRVLAELQPQVIATGHGQSLYGGEVRKALNKLTRHFWELAMPAEGRYVNEPALADDTGITYLPPARVPYKLLTGVGVAALALTLGIALFRRHRQNRQIESLIDNQLAKLKSW